MRHLQVTDQGKKTGKRKYQEPVTREVKRMDYDDDDDDSLLFRQKRFPVGRSTEEEASQ